jgi:hypothetical protein
LSKFRQKKNGGSCNWICDSIGSKTSSQIISLSWHNESLEWYEKLVFISLYQNVIGYKGVLNPSSAWLVPSTAEDPACWKQVSSSREGSWKYKGKIQAVLYFCQTWGHGWKNHVFSKILYNGNLSLKIINQITFMFIIMDFIRPVVNLLLAKSHYARLHCLLLHFKCYIL